MSYHEGMRGELVAEEALGLYGVLTEKDWSTRLESSYLTADQRQQVRETAYVTLVSVADYEVRWTFLREHRKSARSIARSLDLLQRAQAFHQPTRVFYFVRGRCRRLQGNNAAASEDEERFKAAAAQTACDYYLPGYAAALNGDLDEAIHSYQVALTVQPNHYNSLFYLAKQSAEINRPAEAIAYYTACIALRPDHGFAFMSRGALRIELGHFDLARTDLAAALAVAKNDRVRRFVSRFQALLLEGRGRSREAEEIWCRVITIEERLVAQFPDRPQHLERYLADLDDLAWTLATCSIPQLRDPSRAVELARRAVETAPRADRWNTLGITLYRSGDWKAAIVALEKAEALEGDNDLASNSFFLAMAHWQLGQKDQARDWHDKAVAWMVKNRPKDEELLRFRAEAAALMGLVDVPEDVFARP
jgi:tetratricopeptide (TPR) repeat protein